MISLERQIEIQMALLNLIDDGVFYVDERGFLQICNNASAHMLLKSGFCVVDALFFDQCHAPADDTLRTIFRELAEVPEHKKSARVEIGDLFLEIVCEAVLDDTGRFVGIAGIVRDVTEHRRQARMLRQVVTFDSLTHLSNRRHFHIKLMDETLRARRQDYPLSVVIFDIDGFQEVNNRFGHLRGDALLKSIGEIINRNIRECVDTACRYGGDEFTLILPQTTLDQAASVARRIREEISKESDPSVTISGGVAELGARNADSLLRIASRALDRAKNLGGDLIFVEHAD